MNLPPHMESATLSVRPARAFSAAICFRISRAALSLRGEGADELLQKQLYALKRPLAASAAAAGMCASLALPPMPSLACRR